MLVSLSHDFGNYLYDVFVAKFDVWFAFGLAAQLIFTARSKRTQTTRERTTSSGSITARTVG